MHLWVRFSSEPQSRAQDPGSGTLAMFRGAPVLLSGHAVTVLKFLVFFALGAVIVISHQALQLHGQYCLENSHPTVGTVVPGQWGGELEVAEVFCIACIVYVFTSGYIPVTLRCTSRTRCSGKAAASAQNVPLE